MCQAPPRGCILAGPEMEKHVSGATSARLCWGLGLAGLVGLAWVFPAGKCQGGGHAP